MARRVSPPSKGWKKRTYRRTTRRRAQQKRCGAKCFLEPAKPGGRPKYPVCGKRSCTPTCGGAQAAYNRARMQHNKKVMRKAINLAKRKGCAWATDIR